MTTTGSDAGLAPLIEQSGLDATGRTGEPASQVEYRFDPEATVRLLGSTIARLHSTAPSASTDRVPLDPARLVARAEAAIAAGRVTTHDLDPAYRHMSVERLLAVLAGGLGRASTDPDAMVLTHGSPTLDHLWCHDGRALGFVDWSGAALADPYRDLAISATSVASSFGPMLVPEFFDAYGLTHPDPLRLDWYALATQLVR